MTTPKFAIGQRWLSDTESELGLGLVIDVDARTVHILFPKSDETRIYAQHSAPLSRIVFAVGDEIVDQEGRYWQVERLEEHAGTIRYHVTGEQDNQVINKVLNETRLAAHVQLSKPLERLLAGQLDHKEWYDLRVQALNLQADWYVSPLRGLLGARVGLIAHQLYIAKEVGSRFAPRVLLADEVGLGKTIEAGLIIHQQILTGRSERVLILVPDSLQYQWLIEMRRRFNLDFSIFDLARTASIREHDAQQNPFLTEQWIVASLDLLIDHEDLKQQALSAGFDLLVVDEAHHLEWNEQQGGNDRYDVVELFARQTSGVLLLSATPEQLGVDSHFARLRLLDPQRFSELGRFLQQEQHYSQVAKIAEVLLERDTDLTSDQQQSLQQLLGMPIVDDPCGRQHALDALLDRYGTGRVLFRNTRDSVNGFMGRDCLPAALPKPLDWVTTGSLRQQLWGEELQLDGSWLESDPRVTWLLDMLHKALKHQKVLLIARSGPVVEALEMVLRLRGGIRTALFHEEMTLLERDQAAAYFAEESYGAQILLCSEIGSEGRNFQFAHHLVLFDLPANADTLEQRIGRLDRIGQQHRIQIHVPYIQETAQERLFLWYHRALNVFNHISPAAQTLHNDYLVQLKPLLTEPQPEVFEALLQQVQQERIELEHALQQGRDRLLEYHSCRPQIANQLVEQLEHIEDQSLIPEFVKRFAYVANIDFEPQSNSTVIMRATDQTLVEGLNLDEDGLTAVFYRDVAQVREDAEFLTIEHPLVNRMFEAIKNQSLGSCNVATLSSKVLPSGLVLVEVWFSIEVLAPRVLNVKGSLPQQLIRIILAEQGQDLSDKITPDIMTPYVNVLNVQQGRMVIKARQHIIQQRYMQAVDIAQAQLPQLSKQAQQHYQQLWQREIDRLRQLQQVQHSVQDHEIEQLVRYQHEGLEALQQLKIQPEAIRVLVTVLS